MATHSSVLAWRIPGTGNPRSLVGCCLWGCMESDTTEVTQQQQQQDMTIQMSIGRQMHTEAVVHIYNGILLSYKKNTFESVLVWQMNLQPITQSEVSQKEKDKYHILTYIYIESRKMVPMSLCTGQQRRHLKNRLLDSV